MKKDALFYSIVAEGFIQARLEIKKLNLPAEFNDKVDNILFKKGMEVGGWVLKALKADARKVKNHYHLCN